MVKGARRGKGEGVQGKADVQGQELKTWSVGGAATQRSHCGSIWRESTSVRQVDWSGGREDVGRSRT